jgi:hypothetical protein
MNIKLLTIIFCSALVLFIVYKLYNKDNLQIEHFGVLEKMKNINKKKKTNKKTAKFANIKSNKSTTFDDIISITETIDPNKYSIDNMYKNLSDYKSSFNKEKFKNNSKSTAESFEKFAFYKEQFFNIFK